MANTPVIAVFLVIIAQLSALTLPENYDSTTRPNQGGVADVVNISVDLLAIRDLNEAKGEMTVDMSLHTSWVDSRLIEAVNKDSLIVNQMPDIWRPDIQITNSASSSSMESNSNYFLQLNKEGLVKLSKKHTARITCPISHAKYPFDRQICKLQINSFGYSSVHLALFWHGTVSNNVPISHPEFSFSYTEQSSESIKTSNGEPYCNLYLEIAVTRGPLRVIFRAMFRTLILLALSYYISFCHCPLLRNKATTNGHHVESTVIPEPQPQPIPTLSSVPRFNLLLIALNGMIFLLTVLIAQINFVTTPRSSAVSGLDVWLTFVTTLLFVISWHSVQLYFNSTQKRMHMEKDSGSCYVNNINTVFKLGIPPLVVVFLIAYFGVYLS